MGGSEPLLKRLRPGDNVTVTLRRDYATAVRQGKVSQKTADSPEGEPVFVCALALAVICGGAYGL
jgi:translation elongation factor EF-1alpha